jgi:RNA polymerase sigma factor
VASASSRRRLQWSDDAASIALIAFNEAIDVYDEDRGVPFPAFARLVIKCRLTDYYRKESQPPAESFEEMSATGKLGATFSIKLSEADIVSERREEIERFQKTLMKYGMSFRDLVGASPKHKDARMNLLRVARTLAGDYGLMTKLVETKRLPLNELSLATGVPRKTLERGRRYILATSLIMGFPDEFPYLYSHLMYC